MPFEDISTPDFKNLLKYILFFLKQCPIDKHSLIDKTYCPSMINKFQMKYKIEDI